MMVTGRAPGVAWPRLVVDARTEVSSFFAGRDRWTRRARPVDGMARKAEQSAQPAERRKPQSSEDARSFAIAAARLAQDSKATDVVVIDLRGLSGVADFFVVGTGTSDRQMRAVLDTIHEHARAGGRRLFTSLDNSGPTWMLADYVDVVVHMFDEEHRTFYDLDGLWGDAPRVEWQKLDNT